MAKTNWYSEIPYEVNDKNNPITECPFGEYMWINKSKCKMLVASIACIGCRYCLGYDTIINVVMCTNPKNLE